MPLLVVTCASWSVAVMEIIRLEFVRGEFLKVSLKSIKDIEIRNPWITSFDFSSTPSSSSANPRQKQKPNPQQHRKPKSLQNEAHLNLQRSRFGTFHQPGVFSSSTCRFYLSPRDECHHVY